MISDVLHDAVAQIRRYQKALPDVYDRDRALIDHVVEAMERLRKRYDAEQFEHVTAVEVLETLKAIENPSKKILKLIEKLQTLIVIEQIEESE